MLCVYEQDGIFVHLFGRMLTQNFLQVDFFFILLLRTIKTFFPLTNTSVTHQRIEKFIGWNTLFLLYGSVCFSKGKNDAPLPQKTSNEKE